MKKHLLSTLAISMACVVVLAEEHNVETMVVTATRTEQTLKKTLASTTVITKEDIARLQANDVYQILSTVPGVSLLRTGTYGNNISVFLRGTSTSQTLFLIDGQRMSSATLGEPSLAYLNPAQIERIEIVRGPKASLYGADATGGVIQIFTKKGDDKLGVTLSAGVGADAFSARKESYILQQYHIGVSAPIADKTKISVGLSYEDTSGVDSTEDKTMMNGDKDATRNHALNFGITQDIVIGELNFQYLNNEIHTELDSPGGCADIFFGSIACQPVNDAKIENINLNALFNVMPFWDITSSLGYFSEKNTNGDDLNNDLTQVFRIGNVFETERTSASLQNNFVITKKHLLSVGADYHQDKIGGRVYINNGFGTPAMPSDYLDESGNKIDSRDNLAFFAQYQTTLGLFDIVAGMREDDNQDYGTNTTGNIALGITATEHMRVVASWGNAFIAPTFNDLYWPSGANPNLSPEKSDTYELSLNGDYDSLSWQIAVYQTSIDDMIEWAPAPTLMNPFNWQPSNIEKAKIEGLEVIITQQINDWLINGSFSYLESAEYKETVGGTDDGNTLIARPEQTFKLDVDRRWNQVDAGFSLLAESSRFQDKSNNQETGGYGLLNLRMAYHFNNDLKLQFKIDNALDKTYSTRRYSYGFSPTIWENYNTLGRSAFISIVYTPEF